MFAGGGLAASEHPLPLSLEPCNKFYTFDCISIIQNIVTNKFKKKMAALPHCGYLRSDTLMD